MRWVWIVLGALVALVLIMAVVGAMLPKDHVAARRARYSRPPEDVWKAIATIEEFPSWRKDVSRVERLPDREGRPVWREHGSHGPIAFEQVEAVPPRRLVGRIADPDLPFGGTWTYEIAPAEGGCTLTVTERGEVKNVIFRFLSRFIFGHATTIEQYLRALGTKFGQDVTAEPA